MIDLPQEPVPPAIIKFAEQHNIKHVETDSLFKFVKKKCFGYDNIDEAYAGVSENLPEFEKEPENEKLNQVWFL